MAPLGVSFHLLIGDQHLVLSAISVPFDSNWFHVVSFGHVILSKAAQISYEGLKPVCYQTGPGESRGYWYRMEFF